ncbi:hypothetical protein R5R35_003872 [Gryllus longicercus]|uniref:Transcription factor CBF/NF-Y/archaeal histone domain-containing protein n=1 Tax=Gryllus longicercus TaxID=2509291 RepID=A0AAN9V648_9ORTH
METSESEIIEADVTTHTENEQDENGESSENPVREAEKPEKLFKLPLSRIKHIMKMDPDTKHSTQEAAFLIAKATELFLGSLATEAYKQASQAKRKTIQKKDIDSAINCIDSLAFLEGVLE